MEKAHRLYETRISFSAEGRNIELAAIIEIRATGVAKTVLAGPYAKTTQSTIWVRRRLPSGPAVVFHLPNRSDLAKLVRDQERAKASSINYLSAAYWLGDADDPSVIETLVFKAYYEQPAPRLRGSFLLGSPNRRQRGNRPVPASRLACEDRRRQPFLKVSMPTLCPSPCGGRFRRSRRCCAVSASRGYCRRKTRIDPGGRLVEAERGKREVRSAAGRGFRGGRTRLFG